VVELVVDVVVGVQEEKKERKEGREAEEGREGRKRERKEERKEKISLSQLWSSKGQQPRLKKRSQGVE
jgi:hypothetical protein